MMGGYLGTPQRTLTKQVSNVKITIHRVADILNREDSDVSFAYSFCGSSAARSLDGKSDPGRETAERGRQKAQIEYHEPEWRKAYDLWAKSLKGLGDIEVDVWDYGERIADVIVVGVINKRHYSLLLSVDEIDIMLEGSIVAARDVIKLGKSCKKWMKERVKRISAVEPSIGRALKNQGLFLIVHKSDDC